MSSKERSHWRHWLEEPKNPKLAFDLVDSPRDPLPGIVSRVSEACSALRHPRSFFRKVVLGGAAFMLVSRLCLGSGGDLGRNRIEPTAARGAPRGT
jgi:hypothetical protein